MLNRLSFNNNIFTFQQNKFKFKSSTFDIFNSNNTEHERDHFERSIYKVVTVNKVTFINMYNAMHNSMHNILPRILFSLQDYLLAYTSTM